MVNSISGKYVVTFIIGIDGHGYIQSQALINCKTDDRICVLFLLEPVGREQITQVLADSGYDSHKVYQDMKNKRVVVLLPPLSTSAISSVFKPTLQDKVVSCIREKGYWA